MDIKNDIHAARLVTPRLGGAWICHCPTFRGKASSVILQLQAAKECHCERSEAISTLMHGFNGPGLGIRQHEECIRLTRCNRDFLD